MSCREAHAEKDNSLNVSEAVEKVKKLSSYKLGKKAETRRKVTLLGIGMGATENMTVEGVRACNQADCIIGAKRMLTAVEQVLDTEKPMVPMYLSHQIVEYIYSHEEYGNIVIALSGDVGFYSGAKKLVDALPEMEDSAALWHFQCSVFCIKTAYILGRYETNEYTWTKGKYYCGAEQK